MMLEGLKRGVKDQFNGLKLEEICKLTEEELEVLLEKIKNTNKIIPYLQWVKVKVAKKGNRGKKNVSTYRSEKQSISSNCLDFSKIFLEAIRKLQEHNRKKISQYKRIKEIKQIVSAPENKSAAIRIDWSEDATLFQTRQEKSDYYSSTQVAINTAVSYEVFGTQSHATISDATSRRAAAKWASMNVILEHLGQYDHLYIISDSPTSQYRNAFCAYLTKKYAEEHSCKITWVFTETGHGKGPMDGVGGALKNKIDDVIAYLLNVAIRNADQLLIALPASETMIGTYKQEDIDKIQDQIPKKISVKCSTQELGIGTAHEILLPSNPDSNVVYLKQVSTDEEYKVATLHQTRLLSFLNFSFACITMCTTIHVFIRQSFMLACKDMINCTL